MSPSRDRRGGGEGSKRPSNPFEWIKRIEPTAHCDGMIFSGFIGNLIISWWLTSGHPHHPQYPCDCFTVQNEIIHESPPPPQVERTQGKIATLNGSVCAHAHSLIIILTIQSVCNGTLVCHPVGEILAVGRWRWRREGNQLRFYVSRETSKGNEP